MKIASFKSQITVSVIIPCYNSEKTLKRALDCIYNQTFTNIEVIAVNDGSTDLTLKILQEYQYKHSNFHILSQDNKGSGASRNRAMRHANGKYIMFMDSDDFMNEDVIAVLIQEAEKLKAEISQCKVCPISETDFSKKERQSFNPSLYNIEKFYGKEIMEAFLKNSRLNRGPVAKLYLSEIAKSIDFEVGQLHEDNYWNFKFLENTATAVIVDYEGYFYIDNAKSNTKSPFSVKQCDKVIEERKILERVEISYSSLLVAERKNLLMAYWWVFEKNASETTLFSENFKEHRINYQVIKNYFLEDKNKLQKLSGKEKIFYLVLNLPFFWQCCGIYAVNWIVAKK